MANVGQGRYDQGAPPRLGDYAKEAKAKIDANFNKNFDGQPRREEVPVLPPNISRKQFNAAIDELREKIGDEHVELNDKVTSFVGLPDSSLWTMVGISNILRRMISSPWSSTTTLSPQLVLHQGIPRKPSWSFAGRTSTGFPSTPFQLDAISATEEQHV
jgi:hypothetical protein